MKRFLIISIALMFIGLVQADNDVSENMNKATKSVTTIKGIVLDKHTGEALVGVKVNIAELNKEVYTDFDGIFEFKNISKDCYNLQSELISYEKQEVKVELSDELNVILMENK